MNPFYQWLFGVILIILMLVFVPLLLGVALALLPITIPLGIYILVVGD